MHCPLLSDMPLVLQMDVLKPTEGGIGDDGQHKDENTYV